MVNEEQRKLIWKSLLGADYRMRYFGELAGRLQNAGRYIAIANLILSSGAFVTMVTQRYPKIGAVAIGIVAILSAVQLVIKFSDLAGDAADMCIKWGKINDDLEKLWASLEQLEPEEAMKILSDIQSRHTEIDKKAAKEFGFRRRLANRVWREMLQQRNLPVVLVNSRQQST